MAKKANRTGVADSPRLFCPAFITEDTIAFKVTVVKWKNFWIFGVIGRNFTCQAFGVLTLDAIPGLMKSEMNRTTRSQFAPRVRVYSSFRWLVCLSALFGGMNARAQPGRKVIFERISQYHHIQVYDENGVRTLSFNGSWESTMSLTNPLTGHFEYTEYFQMPFIWNPDIKRVLMAGLGGGSTQRAFQHYYHQCDGGCGGT